jgi:tetratricopeptide (TPR) repeat protein
VRQQIYLQKGKSAQAVAELEKLIRDNPKNTNNYVYLADIYMQLGDREKAIAVLQKGKDIDPKSTLIRLSLADNYRALNRFDEAFVELKVAFQGEDLNLDEKIRVILSLFPLFTDAKARVFADELAVMVVRTYSSDPKSYAMYGDVLFQEEKYAGALQAYKSALKLNSQVYEIWEQVVRIELSGDDFQQAIADGDAALVIFPNQVALYLFTGMAYARAQQHEKTITYLKNALGLGSDNKQMLDQIYATLGDSYNVLKQYKQSDEAYEKALEINPGNSYTLNNYAYYLSLRGVELDKAAQMAQRAIALDPNNASSEDTYAWILFKQKKYSEARIWIEKAIHDDKSNSAVQFEHYGDILYHLGEKKQAVAQWKKSQAVGGKSDQLEKKINGQKYIE